MRSLLLCLLAGPALAAPPLLKPASLDASAHHARLKIPAAGRYTLTATSREGTALRLVDRMAGTLARDGAAGGADGRLDVFLDAGAYRLMVERAPKAKGRIELAARHVAPVGEARRLEPFAAQQTTLTDGQARAWWIRVDEPRVVALEAAGRSLDTLRIWRDGRWIDAATPRCEEAQPLVGQPVHRCTLAARLPAGLHRVVAYGGAARKWSAGDAADPDGLFVRWGIPKLAPAGAQRFTVGPSGVARFRVPAGISRAVLALPTPGVARLRVANWSPNAPFTGRSRTARIAQDARQHIAELVYSVESAFIEVHARPGTAAILRWFPRDTNHRLVGPGQWLLGSVQANGDGPPPTAVLTEHTDGRDRVVGESVIAVGPAQPLRAQFNLASEAEIFVRITEQMTVHAEATGARLTLIPLWTRPPREFRMPDALSVVEQVVTPGLYRLRLLPDRATITTLAVHAAGSPAPTVDTATPTGLSFAPLALGQGEARTVLRARSPVASALVRLDAPVDLAAGVPLHLGPGAVIEVPIQPGAGVTRALDLMGTPLQLSRNGLAWGERLERVEGSVFVRNPSPRWATALVQRVPASAVGGPLPPVTAADKALLPDLPRLTPKAPAAVTMPRNSERSWRITVPQAGAWLAESTGLLATSGHLRTRTRVRVDASASAMPATTTREPVRPAAIGASGRNFGIGRYLRAGEYLLTVATRGKSTGRMGVKLSTTPLRDEGALVPERVARARALPGEAVAWRFDVAEDGQVEIEAQGPAGTLPCRIEDADGWPVDPPVSDCEGARKLSAGQWRVIVLPTRDGGLRRVRMRLPRKQTVLKGAGPHPLVLDRTVRALWREPTGEAPRAPQTFAFTMPAAGDVSITAPDSMLVEIHDATQRVARVSPGRSYTGPLAMGVHTLRVVGARRDDGVEYTLAVRPAQLLPGLTRSVSMDRHKAQVTAIVPTTGLYTVFTDGQQDARITLRDADGASLAVQDDRPDDWNARLTRRLTPGRYTIEVELPSRWGSTVVGLDAVRPVAGEAIPLGDRRTVTPTSAGLLLPITGQAGLIAGRIEATENVGIAIEAQAGDGWQTLASATGRTPIVAARPAADSVLRARIWSLDGLERAAALQLTAIQPAPVAEAKWQRGAALPADRLGGLAPRVDAGAFVVAPTPGLLVCPRVGTGCSDARAGGLPIAADGVRFVGFGGRISGRRIRADEAVGPILPVAEAAQVDLPRGAGPLIFEASAPLGQPTVALGDGPRALVKGRALAVDLGGKSRQGQVQSSDGAPINTRLRAWRLATVAPKDLGPGRTRLSLAPGTALVVNLPAGPRRLRALVPHHGVLVMPRLDGATALAWGAAGPVVDGARGVADAVHLLNPTGEAAVFEIEVIADASGAPPAISAVKPFEARTVRSGVTRLAVAADAGARLNLRGASGHFARNDGRIFWLNDGDSAPTGAGGRLVLRHGVGPVLAWLASDARPGPWASDPEVQPVAVSTTRQVRLDGAAQRFRIAWPEPRMLHLRVAGDVVLRVERAGGGTAVLFGGAHDLWLPEGTAIVTARGLGGTPLAGEMLISSSRPATLTEGVGPATLLGPGDTRLYQFETAREAAIGVGVRAKADRVQASVYRLDGSLVARGGSVMPKLTAGTWLLALHLPPDAAPIEARPALIGIAPRGDGPPASTIRSYVENAR